MFSDAPQHCGVLILIYFSEGFDSFSLGIKADHRFVSILIVSTVIANLQSNQQYGGKST